MITTFCRRMVLGLVLLGATPLPVAAAAGYAATHGAAPFATEHLIPGTPLDLGRVDLSDPRARVIALTLDDGPVAADRRILDILARHHAHATFFVVGRNVDARPEMVRRMAAEGHEVGHHSQSHQAMSAWPAARQRTDLATAHQKLTALGIRPAWFRPPFGDVSPALVAEAARLHMNTALWTLDSRDWKNSPAAVVAGRVVPRLKPGVVLLMHSNRPGTPGALETILTAAEKQGYRVVTLSEWYATMATMAPIAANGTQVLGSH